MSDVPDNPEPLAQTRHHTIISAAQAYPPEMPPNPASASHLNGSHNDAVQAKNVNGHTNANLTANMSPEEVSLFTCLSAYADALDALPLDLTRSFSDLRELDAVLGPHIASLVQRIHGLTEIVRDVDGSAQRAGITAGQRLLLLKDCAEEARSYKMGGEDKIRVALNTCETIMSHTDYIDAILDNLLALPELKELVEPEQRHHIAGELSDGTPITLASANAATALAGGSGMFANPSSSGTVGGGPTVGGTGGVAGTYNGMEVERTAVSGAGTKGSKKKQAQAAAASAAAAAAAAAQALEATTAGKGSASSGKAAGGSTATGTSKKRKGGAGAGVDDDKSSATTSATGANKKGGSRKKAGGGSSNTRMDPSASPGIASNGLKAGDGSSSRGGGTKSGGAEESAYSTPGSSSRRGAGFGGSSNQQPSQSGASNQGADISRAGSEYEEGRSATGNASRARAARAPRGSGSRRGGGGAASHRSGGGDGDDDQSIADEGPNDDDDVPQQAQRSASSRRRGGGADDAHTTGSSSLTSLSALGLSNVGSEGQRAHQDGGKPHRKPTPESAAGGGAASLGGANAGQSGGASVAAVAPSSVNGDEPDDTRYCFCENVSYGDMIGCDNDNCEREWFHLECIGLTRPPSGTWYCDPCLEERSAKFAKSKAKRPRWQRTTGTHGGGGTEIQDGPGAGGKAGRSGGGGGRR